MKRIARIVLILGVLVLTASVALAQGGPSVQRGDATSRPVPAHISGARLDQPMTVDAAPPSLGLSADLSGADGAVQVVVRLSEPAVASAAADGADGASQDLARAAVNMQQRTVIANARALDSNAQVLGQTELALNAVMLEIDAAALAELARNPDVVSINPVRNYEVDLSETVPYIGASAVQSAGYDGSGVSVAVLDTGIDYTHIAFGGSGDVDDYLANDPTIIEPGSFPTAKVVGGYDFVGGQWPNGALAPDPDPLDDGPEGGHGTHVADIIGGANGVAPGVDLYAVKVCSSVSTSCSGVALLNGMDFALDPNMDGDMSDRVDIINMSLGSPYGDPRYDDLSYAVEVAAQYGILTVTSSGNSADKPYVTGTPGASPSSLSTAQTAVPSSIQALMEVTAPESIAGLYAAVYQSWSAPLDTRVEGPMQYGDGAGGNLLGCSLGADPNSVDPANAPYPPGSLDGKIVLVDRGVCNFSVKIYNIQQGGGVAGIIGLVAPGAPFDGALGNGGPFTIQGYMISQADSNALKSGMPDTYIVFDPANGISLVQHMVGSSSRGPNVGLNGIKPEIGAPGASVSAEYGTGTGTTPFGGTSGASPMVAGSAALLMEAYPDREWYEIKSVLINNGETDIMNIPAFFGGDLAAITRIGGGEVRVSEAVSSTLAAWDRNSMNAALSFGFHDVDNEETVIKRVRIQNYSNQDITLRSWVEHRFANDTNGVVTLRVPSWFTVPKRGNVDFPVHLRVRPWPSQPLHDWAMNSGSQGANGDTLSFNEYDGYIYFQDVRDADNVIHMPWQVLPRPAGLIQTGQQQTGRTFMHNRGKYDSDVFTYSLVGVSDRLANAPGLPGEDRSPIDIQYVGVQTYPVPAGFCSADESFVMEFAFHVYDRISHANLGYFDVLLDVDGDGSADYDIYNWDLTNTGAVSSWDGRNVTWVYNFATGTGSAFFFTGHDTNSGNFVLALCGEQIGMNASNFFQTFDAVAIATDWYFSGEQDVVDLGAIAPLGERYIMFWENGDFVSTTIPTATRVNYDVIDFVDQINTNETGVLALYGPGAKEGNDVQAFMFGP